MSADVAPFTFPPEYNFPPFFTPQPNTTTRHAQLTKWSALILSYCRHYHIFRLSIASSSSSSSNSAASSTPDELFHNKSLGRRLSAQDVKDVFGFMKKEGRAEFVGGGGGGAEGGDVVFVYWRTPEEWAGVVEGWVEETGQKGTVMTVYELVEGEGTRGTEIHGIDTEILLKALNIIVKRGKAQIFGQEESQGVKFF